MLIGREVDHTIENLKKWMANTSVDQPMLTGIAESYIVREPLGVFSVIGSWNYPYLTVLCPLVSVIAAGNCAIIKPSELSPWSSTELKNLIARYLDTSCFQCVLGGVKVAIRSTSVKVDKIIFTGSTEKGALVAQSAAKNLVPCILELGGKSPCIIDKGADLSYTASKISFCSFFNFGQTCVRPDYILIDYSIVN